MRRWAVAALVPWHPGASSEDLVAAAEVVRRNDGADREEILAALLLIGDATRRGPTWNAIISEEDIMSAHQASSLGGLFDRIEAGEREQGELSALARIAAAAHPNVDPEAVLG